MSGSSPLCYVFFTTQHLSVEKVNALFDKRGLTNKDDIIVCDYPQKGLEEFLKISFPELFNSNRNIVYSQ